MDTADNAAPGVIFDKKACRRRDMGVDGAMGECLSAFAAQCPQVIPYSYGYICKLSRADWSAMFQEKRHS
jgi:hypothetical protein